MSYNPFEEKRKNETLTRLRKENKERIEYCDKLEKALDEARLHNSILEGAVRYLEANQAQWIKIESESDLPKEKGDYWIANENGVFDFIASREQIKAKFENNTCTHYMPIIKPEPPKED